MRPLRTLVTLLTGLATVGALASAAPAGGATPPSEARLTAGLSSPVEDPYYPAKGDPRTDALHYALRLSWSPSRRVLTGRAAITLRVTEDTRLLQLDLGRSLAVRSARLDGRTVTVTRPGDHLVVDAGRTLAADTRHVLVVRYAGTPRTAKAPVERSDFSRTGWVTTKDGGAWTMQEPFGAFTWYPVNDQPSDKATYDARISVPKRMVGVFNGRMVSRSVQGSRTVTRWDLGSPAASYLVTIAIGDYVRVADRGPHGLRISYWVDRRTRAGLSLLRETPRMLRWLESKLGPFPFNRIGAVMVPSDSAMETQTLVTMGTGLLTDARLFRTDLLHEYAHQWYGDAVGPSTWPDLWLNESFAMYTQIRWDSAHNGNPMDVWMAFLRSIDNDLRADDGPPGAFHKGEFADQCVYYCGALMLDRLRTKVGPAAFADLWRAWPQRHRGQALSREDYITWASQRTGQDLRPFLTRWLTSPRTPGT